jgi:hypothetical protein
MKLHRPVVSVYTVPTDAPEADGTFAWDVTTMVIAEVTTGEETGTGWTYGPAAVGDFLTEQLGPLVEGRSRWTSRRCTTRCAVRSATRAVRASRPARSRRSTSPCGT